MEKSTKKVLVICHITKSLCNGQVAKTKDVIDFLILQGFDVSILNYGQMNKIRALLHSKSIISKFDKVVLMPGGSKALFFYSKLISKLRIKNSHYVAIGGWVQNLLKEKKAFQKLLPLKSFKGIYLQNKDTQKLFKEKGFENSFCISSFSSKKPISTDELTERVSFLDESNNFKFCFFARIIREKGIYLAIESILRGNKQTKSENISLDIYGEFSDKKTKDNILSLCEKAQSINYKGVLSGPNTTKTLSKYYCMLFPTFYRGEGVPHTIIESFASGLPVIASKWAYNEEIIENHKTGLLFELKTDELTQQILYATQNKQLIKTMSVNCLEEFKKYNIEVLLKPLINNLSKD